MQNESLSELALRQEWTTPIEERLQKGISNIYAAGGEAGQKVENALHGTWLGHALHPVLTDIPIGAWTVAVALDAADAIRGQQSACKRGGCGNCGRIDWRGGRGCHGSDGLA